MDVIYKKGDEVTVGYPYAEGGFCQIDAIENGTIIDIDFNCKKSYLIQLEGHGICDYPPEEIICLTKDFTVTKLKEFIIKTYKIELNKLKEEIKTYKKDLKYEQNGYKIFLDNAEQICEELFKNKDIHFRSNSFSYNKFKDYKPYKEL